MLPSAQSTAQRTDALRGSRRRTAVERPDTQEAASQIDRHAKVQRSRSAATKKTLELFFANNTAELEVQQRIDVTKRKVAMVLAERRSHTAKEQNTIAAKRSLKFDQRSKTAVSSRFHCRCAEPVRWPCNA